VSDPFDAVVIGGGPAGSTVATLASQAGRRICVLERERFPRFHVGESLLPYNNALFERLGVMGRLEDRSIHIRKYGATFMGATGAHRCTYRFDEALRPEHPYAFQVERAGFDEMLLARSREVGAEVREGWRAVELLRDRSVVSGVVAEAPDGRVHEVPASLVVDASGRQTFIASREGLRRSHPELRKACVWAHFDGIEREAGEAAGNIRIVAFEDGWAWVIPFASGRTSVGLVLHGRRFKARKGDIESFWTEELERAPALAQILEPAARACDFQTVPTIAYDSKRWSGDGWVVAGDAAIFLDPVFSTGVLLAMTAGALVADVISAEARPGWRPGAATFARYERSLRSALLEVSPFIRGFYDPSFLDRFMRPSDLFRVRAAVTSLLAGDLRPKWIPRMRRSVFWAGVRRTRKLRQSEGLPVESALTH
jgi:flavin-dependent dehydrogenase